MVFKIQQDFKESHMTQIKKKRLKLNKIFKEGHMI